MDLSERRAGAGRHPWELARAELFLDLLREHGALASGHDWLDVGAGDVWFASRLRARLPETATVTCWDPAYTEDDLAAEHPGVALTAERPERRFDRVLMLDVVEHVEDDGAFVAGVATDFLDAGGLALVSVPAYQALFSEHDRALRHERRYSPADCRALLERSGLEVVADGGLFSSLLLVRAGQTALERAGIRRSRRSGVGSWNAGSRPTAAIRSALVADGRLSLALSRRGRALPGLSFWALCRHAG